MNIGEFGKIVGAQADALGNKIQKKSQKKMGEGLGTLIASGTIEKDKIKNVNVGKIGRTLGGGIGGGAEGLIAGAAGGAVIGGVAGGIDEDETFLGGAARGALTGGALGGAAGIASGALHNNAGLLMNVGNDAEAVAARISKWRTGMGDGISNIRTRMNNYGNIFDPKVKGVL